MLCHFPLLIGPVVWLEFIRRRTFKADQTWFERSWIERRGRKMAVGVVPATAGMPSLDRTRADHGESAPATSQNRGASTTASPSNHLRRPSPLAIGRR